MADPRLVDLSGHDSDELMRFNEKRKWFESVLKVLEELPPIFPFAMLRTETEPHEKDAMSTSSISDMAPSTNELDDMQKERDDIEVDVTSFDNGDLVRMKEKTRVVTLSPLSPPSTELVSITLDLIVIVDRLLTLLRQRSELIDLCRLRLQWEALRSQCIQDCDRFSASVDSIVTDYLDWLPVSIQSTTATKHEGQEISSSPNGKSAMICEELSKLESPSKPARDTASSDKSPNSSGRMNSSPSMNKLRLPLIRSRIESLQIRFDSLSTTTLPRLGAMLDKMIDTAAPLKASGAAQGIGNSGVLPDYLLDAQDDIEARVSGLSSYLAMCRRLEHWWSRAESNHSTMISVRDSASKILLDIKYIAITPSASVSSLQPLQTRIASLRAALPDISESPCLPVADPRTQDHHIEINRILRQTFADANRALHECTSASDWVHRHGKSADSLSKIRDNLVSRESRFKELLELADNMEAGAMTSDQACPAWLSQSRDVLDEHTASDLIKLATIALFKHRASAKSRPLSLQATSLETEADPLSDQVDTAIDTVTHLASQMRSRCEIVERTHDLEATIQDLQKSIDDVHTVLVPLEDELTRYVDATIWPTSTASLPVDREWERSLARAAQSVLDIETRLSSATNLLHGVTAIQTRPLQNTRSAVDDITEKLEHLERLRSLAHRVHLQSSTVAAVLQEGKDLLTAIAAARSSPDEKHDLRDEIAEWEAEVVARIPFIDIYHPQSINPASSGPSRGVYPDSTTRPLLTPPPSPPRTGTARALPNLQWDLSTTDQAVRAEINTLTSRIRSQLERINTGPSSTVDRTGLSKPPARSTARSVSSSTPIPNSKQTSAKLSLESLQLSYSTSTSASSSRLPTPTRPRVSLPSLIASQRRLPSTVPHATRSRPAIPFPVQIDRSRSVSLGHSRTPQKSRQVPRRYVANDRNQLDRAVGQIVNSLPIHVPVAPIGTIEPNEWNDVTGRYWIGAEGRAKLCYCRILRSQTVMVRVGGGWIELSKFIAEHFSDTLTLPEVPDAGAPTTAQLPSTPASRHLASDATPRHPTTLSRSTSSTHSLTLGPGSPLAPLRFMRKASDSPEDRKKEKSSLKLGRRSILGKE